MSLHQNWVTLATVDIPWKSFIRESNEITPSESGQRFSTCLSFKGMEAKNSYEEVIRQNFKSENTPKSNIELSNRSKCNNLQTLVRHDTSVVNQVSTNSILKAVEQNDMHFLKKHLNLDNVDACDDFGWTPLMSAAYNGNLEVVEYLLRLGVNKKAKERSGLTAAQLALKRNHLNVVALLKRRNPQKDGENINTTPLQNYTENSNREDERAKTSRIECTMSNVIKDPFDSHPEFYCKVCELAFKESTVKQHESSTLHIFNTKPKLRSVAYGIAKQNKGYQMLLNTGWDEENGLGPLGEGTKYPIKTILKRDRKGFCEIDAKDARVTHFKSGDVSAIAPTRMVWQKTLKKKDREKLLARDALKGRIIRMALS
ncbi:G patch domain and ankyrin repeat-containing protein 1 homolog [Athalia rosae]|uniref:G patch domain and ankyrin repeat-containing protein 1 homolog n=1 Tax=Athalia rosae TaxID=37344 RepID=UPI002033EEAF|nr:G patch domain and ankyrin repeat-containing protein 1 homolog [Athalia rosae]